MGYDDKPVLGSDTVVVVDNLALGKPVDEADFIRHDTAFIRSNSPSFNRHCRCR